MWNAYQTAHPALPDRDVRFNNVKVDGLLTLGFNAITLDLVEEDGLTITPLNCFYSKIGRIISLIIPQTPTFEGTMTLPYKVLILPLAIAAGPVAGKGETQVIFAKQGGGLTPGAGVAVVESSSEIKLYSLVSQSAPTSKSLIETCQFNYKSAA